MAQLGLPNVFNLDILRLWLKMCVFRRLSMVFVYFFTLKHEQLLKCEDWTCVFPQFHLIIVFASVAWWPNMADTAPDTQRHPEFVIQDWRVDVSTLYDVCGHVFVSFVLRNYMFQNLNSANDMKPVTLFCNRFRFICFNLVVITLSAHVHSHFYYTKKTICRNKVRAKRNESNQKMCLMQSAGGISF